MIPTIADLTLELRDAPTEILRAIVQEYESLGRLYYAELVKAELRRRRALLEG